MRQHDARLVHLSIDLVFSGTRGGGHVEDDPTDPVTVYGKTMVAAERVDRRADCPRPASLRISLPMGVSFNGHAGAIDWIQSRFKKSKPATLYFDEIRTPTYTDCLNRAVRDGAGRRAGGPVSRRRPAAAEPVSNRADHQSRRRLRSATLDGLPAHRGRPDSAAGGRRFDGFEQAGRGAGLSAVSRLAVRRAAGADASASGTSSGPADEPGSRAWLAEVLYRNPRRG